MPDTKTDTTVADRLLEIHGSDPCDICGQSRTGKGSDQCSYPHAMLPRQVYNPDDWGFCVWELAIDSDMNTPIKQTTAGIATYTGKPYAIPAYVPFKTTDATAKHAYQAACRIMDRDGALGMETDGILDNVMAELARLASVP